MTTYIKQGEFLVNKFTTGDQRGPIGAALSNGNFAVTWNSVPQDGSSNGAYGRVFYNNGTVLSDEIQINQYTPNVQSPSGIASLKGEKFVVVWDSLAEDGDSYGTYSRVFSSTGVPKIPEFLVNNRTYKDQSNGKVAGLESGGFVIIYEDNSALAPDPYTYALYGQLYDSTYANIPSYEYLTASPFQFLINNEYVLGQQIYVSVANLKAYGFVTTWTSNRADDSGYGITGRVFNNNGKGLDHEFHVNQVYTTGDQLLSRVAALSDGNYVITWNSYGQDGSGYGVYGRVFGGSNGFIVSPEFIVNQVYTTGNQLYPEIAAFDNGNFVVTWETDKQDGNGYGVFYRVFNNNGVALTSELRGSNYIVSPESSSVTALSNGNFVVTWDSNGYSLDGNGYGVYGQIFQSDSINYSSYTSGVSVDISLVDFISVKDVTGSSFADSIVGNANINNIQGGAGDDNIEGKAGADVLDGGTGTDTASYSTSSAGVTVSLTSGVGSGGDASGDTLTNFENLIGSGYADTLTGNVNNNNIQGGAGADVLNGGAGTDTASYSTSSAGVTVSLTSGTGTGGDASGDTLTNFENLIGSGYADTLTGDVNNNNIQGGAGDDNIEGKAGADVLDGGVGIDTASYSTSSAGVTVSLTSGTGSGGDANGDTLTNFENLIGSGYADTLTGNVNNNNIQGGAGDDNIEGKAGADVLDGGTGTDTLTYSSSPAAVIINLATNTANGGDAEGDVISNFENLMGSGYADTLTGDVNNNNIQGGAGNDNIEGKAGADVLDGGTGTDTASYSTSSAGVTVSLTSGVGSGGDANGDTFTNFENLIGSGYADTLTGDVYSNNIQGGASDDNIEGKAGADVLDGGAGIDTTSYSTSSAGVTVSLTSGIGTGGDAEGDVISNFENLMGSGHADTLTGDVNNNNIQGGDGDDILKDGNGGDDIFTGGGGSDIFTISSSSGSARRATSSVQINDFNANEGDKIDLSAFHFDYTQVSSSAQNIGNNCKIVLGNKNIIIQNTNKANIQGSWFIFSSKSTDDLILGFFTTKDFIGMAISVGASLLTLPPFIYKSYEYYKPKVLGRDHYYSYAASQIPTCIKATTSAVIQNADDAMKTFTDLKIKLMKQDTENAYNQLKDAAELAKEACTKVVEFITEEVTNGVPNAKEALVSYTGFLEEQAINLAEYMEKIAGITGTSAPGAGVGVELKQMSPIGIALSSDKIDLVSLNMSNILFDYEDNGTKSKTSWIGSRDAFLIYDHNDNKQVDYAKELVLTKWSKTAKTDLEALKEVFDSNKDNKFDTNDNEFHKFYIWQDKNQDGISQSDELTSLMEAGLKQIDFNTEKNIQDEFFGNYQEMKVVGVIWEDGHQTLAYDLILESM